LHNLTVPGACFGAIVVGCDDISEDTADNEGAGVIDGNEVGEFMEKGLKEGARLIVWFST